MENEKGQWSRKCCGGRGTGAGRSVEEKQVEEWEVEDKIKGCGEVEKRKEDRGATEKF